MIKKRNLGAFFFILPAFITISIICFYPIVDGILLSFKKYIFGSGEWTWAGLDNFITIFKRGMLLDSIEFTLVFSITSTVCLFIGGIFFALLIDRKMVGVNVIKSISLLPWSIPAFVGAYLWIWLFDQQFGILNYILVGLHITKDYTNWIASYNLAKVTVIIPFVWRLIPFNMIIYLSAFQSIDKNLYEAAEIDGANNIKKFFFITIPSIWNIIVMIALLNFIWSFQEFTTIWLITGGGPGTATDVASLSIYRSAFSEMDFGVASAKGIIWLLFMLIITIFSMKVFTKE